MEPPGLGGARYLTFLIMKNGPITHSQDWSPVEDLVTETPVTLWILNIGAGN